MGQTTEELNAEIAGTREALASNLDALQDRVSPSAIVERRKAAAKGRMRQLRSQVMGTGQSTTSGTGDMGGSMKDGAQGAVSTAEEKIEGSPLAAGLIAFAAGVLISALMPVTEAEARASQRLVDAAKEHGQPLVEEATSMGQDVGAQLKDLAAQAAQGVKDTAQESAERVQDEAKSSVQEVKSQAQN
jgi:ElaB/YqjD/DUF883 family membrane-anchored ribosome-binding protein